MDLAEKYFRQTINIEPKDIESLRNLAMILMQSQRAGEAVFNARTALLQRPKEVESLKCTCLTLLRKGKIWQASEYFRQSLELKPENPALKTLLHLRQKCNNKFRHLS